MSIYPTLGLCEFCHQRFTDLERHIYQCTLKAALDGRRLWHERLSVKVNLGGTTHPIIIPAADAVSLLEDFHNAQPTTVSDQLVGAIYLVGDTAGLHDLHHIFPSNLATPYRDCDCTEQQMSPFETSDYFMIPIRDLRNTNGIQNWLWVISQWYRVAKAMYNFPPENRSIKSFHDVSVEDAGMALQAINQHLIRLSGRFGFTDVTQKCASEQEMWRDAVLTWCIITLNL